MKENVCLNHTLDEYNKKYRNRTNKLRKFSKKEVDDYDNKHLDKDKGYLLKGHKWWLIDDTYYEIPKPFTLTWFRNLNKAIQICSCLLIAGVIATSVTVPLMLLNKQTEPNITITGATIDKANTSISLNKEFTITFTYGDDKEFVKINFVKVNGNEISKDLYTLLDGNDKSKKVVIKAEAMTSIKVDLSVELKDKEPGPTPEEKYTITLEANPTIGGSVTGGGEYVKGTSITVTATPNANYSFNGWHENDIKVSSDLSYTFNVTCTRTLQARFIVNKYTLSLLIMMELNYKVKV